MLTENLIGAKPDRKTINLLNEAMVDYLSQDAQKDLLVGLVEIAETLDLDQDIIFQGFQSEGYMVEIAVDLGNGIEIDYHAIQIDLYWDKNIFKCFKYIGSEYEKIAEVTGDEANNLAKRVGNLALKWASGLTF